MGISKTSDYIQIKIKMPNPGHEPPASSRAQNQDLKDMEVLCTFKIIIKMSNPNQEPTEASITQSTTQRTCKFFAPLKSLMILNDSKQTNWSKTCQGLIARFVP